MGGVVSAGEDNDNLVENLVTANYIRTAELIEIFRSVDRGHYYLKGQRNSAYHDMAWKFEHLHLSAPCIYSEVMENLDLRPGLSFLNLGSGTGYLSTMVGLVLGSNGINHGIEIFPDVVDYANARLKEFILKSSNFDRFEFCRPHFQVGNCLLLPPDTPGYDRIYCGAACPADNANYLMNLLNVGGKLVLPLDDHLQVKTRTSDKEWDSKSVLTVSFATLIPPNNGNNNKDLKITRPPERNVLKLQELCRFCIRQVIRNKFKIEMPPKKERQKRERHQSLGIEEHIVARHREIVRVRRRRTNTTGESSTRRRRMNTFGDSDHDESSDSSETINSSDDENDNDMETTTQKNIETKELSSDTKLLSSGRNETQNELTNDTNDITLSDPDNEKPENSSTKHDDAQKKAESSKKDAKGNKGETKRNRKLRLRFLRSKPKKGGGSNQGQGDASNSSKENQETETTTNTETTVNTRATVEPEGEASPPRQPSSLTNQGVPHHTRDRLSHMLRGLRSFSQLDDNTDTYTTPQSIYAAINDLENEEEKSENSDSDSEMIFQPLAETAFTIAIRKLSLPPRLISYLLYYRQ